MLAPDLETLNLKLTVRFRMLLSIIQPCSRADECALALSRCWMLENKNSSSSENTIEAISHFSDSKHTRVAPDAHTENSQPNRNRASDKDDALTMLRSTHKTKTKKQQALIIEPPLTGVQNTTTYPTPHSLNR